MKTSGPGLGQSEKIFTSVHCVKIYLVIGVDSNVKHPRGL